MFSGNETQLTESERTYPTQWALNPTAYQNVANDQVDWAALAHQWIMMKESCPPEQVPSAPPPPPIGPLQSNSNVSASNTSLIEGGEAPMEVEDDKDEVKTSISPSASAPPPTWSGSASTSTNWNWQQQWGWNSNWSGPQGATGPTNSITSNSVTGKPPLLPSPYPFPGQTADSSTGSTFSSFTGVRATGYNSGYWTTANDQPRPRVPNKLKSRRLINSDEEVEQQSTVTLDAAKRRQLPAWIREGLEKMEREKQKQLEKEREVREREEYLKRKKEEEEHVRKVMTDSGIVTLPTKSKFDSDSDEFEHSDGMALKQNSSPTHLKNILNTVSPEPTNILKSKEERVQDVMLNVRRLMTEILLDVTTDEIDKICREEMKRYQGSASAMNLQKTPALASLSGKLGLDIYGDSGSSESDSDASNRNDSDSELKEKIRQRKTEFSRTEQEIEARVLEAEREQAEREQNSWRKADESDGSDRDTQVDTAQSHHGDLEKSPTRKMRHHDTQFSITLNKHVSPTNVEKVIIGSKKSIEELTRRDSLKSHSDNKNQIRDNSSTSSSRSRSSSTENSHTQSSDSSSDSDSDSSNFNSYKKSSVNRSSTHCKTKKNNNSLSTRGRDSQSSSSETRKFDKDFKNPSNSRSHKDHENFSKKYVPESNIINYDEKGDVHENQPDRRCNINNRVKYSQSPKRTCHSSYSSKGRNSRSNTTRRSRSREKRTRSRSRDHRLGRSHSKEHDRRDKSKSRERKRDRSRSQDRDRSRSKNRRRSRSRDKRRSRSRDRKRSRSRSLRRSKKFRRH